MQGEGIMLQRYMKGSFFEKITPEEVGITSASVINMLEQAEKLGLRLNSFMLLRHGRAAVQCWWKPYAPEYPQHVYSFGKSVTSTAVGFALSEGLLSLDDRVASFFPRRVSDAADARVYSMTVRHLLNMTSGAVLFNEATMQLHSDWVQRFLNTPLMSFPGDKFVYNSLNTYMLSAILRKVTGVGLVDYLMPRLFEPLEIERPEWDKCPLGIECGGWGLSLRTEDMAKLCQLYLDDGMWRGRRILPEGWVSQACSRHTATDTDDKFSHEQNRAGYGFQFWLNSDGVSCRADGMMGQYGIIMPEKDVVIVTTASVAEQMKIFDLLWDTIVSCIDSIPEGSRPGADYDELCQRCEQLATPVPQAVLRSRTAEQQYSGMVFTFPRNISSMVPLAVRYLYDMPMMGIDELRFDFGDDSSYMTWHEDGSDHRLCFTFDGEYTDDLLCIGNRNIPVKVYAAWTAADTLQINIRLIQTPHMLCAMFRFSDDIVTCTFEEDPSINDSLKMVIGLTSITRPVSERFARVLERSRIPLTGRIMKNAE